jgi:AraC family transcriptional regulator
MPRRNEIKNSLSPDLFSMQIYDESFSFANFNPQASFVKRALIEVSNFDSVPEGMETFILPAGLYAVFLYKGLSTDTQIFQYIYGTWIPNSEYELDLRPHFEIMGEKYKNNDPDSEEEIWIPVKLKK